MEAIPNCASEREIPSKNGQANSPIDRMFGTHRFVPGEEDGLRDRFLDDLHSVRHIGAVTRRQTCDARAPRPAVRAIARRRRRANAFYEATGIRVRE
jgi:hypothetical protein